MIKVYLVGAIECAIFTNKQLEILKWKFGKELLSRGIGRGHKRFAYLDLSSDRIGGRLSFLSLFCLFSCYLYGILERESKDLTKITAAYDLHRALRKDLQREQVRAEKLAETEEFESHDPGTGYTMKRINTVGAPGGGPGFMAPHKDKGPTIMTNIPSQRVADYSEVGGNYQTYQSSGAYGNTYTWQYNKSK